jgi:hypothetical protein
LAVGSGSLKCAIKPFLDSKCTPPWRGAVGRRISVRTCFGETPCCGHGRGGARHPIQH